MPVIEELLAREILVEPRVLPRYLRRTEARERLVRCEETWTSFNSSMRAEANMEIGIVVNDIETEESVFTSTRLAMTAVNRGHTVWVMSPGDFAYDLDEKVHACVRRAPGDTYKVASAYLKALRGPEALTSRITVDELDVLMLRSDPAQDISHAWQQFAGIDFARIALRSGVIVLNDPSGLAKAVSKMYFQLFPPEVRPRTLISRNHDDIKSFIKSEGGKAVLKPLQGSGGSGVFLVERASAANVNQMIDALTRDGYVIAQEYLKAAEKGDTRLFMMNGEAFRYKGHYAAFCRLRSGGDVRSNITAGGHVAKAQITDAHLRIADMVSPKLVSDGMFFVGLDIVGDKLMEINVFSPGGLGVAQTFERVSFTSGLIEALERKVEFAASHGHRFSNIQMATL